MIFPGVFTKHLANAFHRAASLWNRFAVLLFPFIIFAILNHILNIFFVFVKQYKSHSYSFHGNDMLYWKQILSGMIFKNSFPNKSDTIPETITIAVKINPTDISAESIRNANPANIAL